jgi:cytochrome P450
MSSVDMSVLASEAVLRNKSGALRRRATAAAFAALPFAFRVLRRVHPIVKLGSFYIVTSHDDVREVFGSDRSFHVPYDANIRVITGGEPFFLGLRDGPEYRAGLDAMRRVFKADDLPRLALAVDAQAQRIVDGAGGRLEVVDRLVRRVSFDLYADYIGVAKPASGSLDVWATRLFEFQFAGSPTDHELRAEVDVIAPAFRAHIDREIARRKQSGDDRDDVMGRCLQHQAAGVPGYSDVEIRTALLCMIVGGPPQPPMVVPQAMEQLLRRPAALAQARQAALDDNDALLHNIIREAMRFDPLAPGLPRVATTDTVIARGTRRARTIPNGATVLAAFASGMMDARRIPAPRRFDPQRLSHEYIHFGYGLHECFGRHLNAALLHRMVKPLLKRANLRREPGSLGRLRKQGPFAERLFVRFD